MFNVANIINSRPLGVVSGSDPEQPCAITPNDLILGRSTSDVPQCLFNLEEKNINKHFRYLKQLVEDWWKAWYESVFPYLVPSYKWLQRHRNVKVGDICLIKYKSEIRATYRLGRVRDVKKGSDGLVRTVILEYKLSGEKKFRTVDRPVQGVSVIVPIEEQNKEVSTVNSSLDPTVSEFTPKEQ